VEHENLTQLLLTIAGRTKETKKTSKGQHYVGYKADGDKWYNIGEDVPGWLDMEKGKTYDCGVSISGDWRWIRKYVEVDGAAPASAPAPSASPAPSPRAASGSTNASIERQTSAKVAGQIVAARIAAGLNVTNAEIQCLIGDICQAIEDPFRYASGAVGASDSGSNGNQSDGNDYWPEG
jgi:hypothetical protein